jgi:hypothetical protein
MNSSGPEPPFGLGAYGHSGAEGAGRCSDVDDPQLQMQAADLQAWSPLASDPERPPRQAAP